MRAGTGCDVAMQVVDVGEDRLSPRRARKALRPMLADAGWEPARIDEVLVVVSELVANAVVHGGGLRALHAAVQVRGAHFAVDDDSPTMPVRRVAARDADSGRGLAFVEALSDAWGATLLDGRDGAAKRVWCEIGRDRPLSW